MEIVLENEGVSRYWFNEQKNNGKNVKNLIVNQNKIFELFYSVTKTSGPPIPKPLERKTNSS